MRARAHSRSLVGTVHSFWPLFLFTSLPSWLRLKRVSQRLGTKLPFKIPILTPAIPTFPSLTSKRPLNPLSDQGKGVGSCQTTLHRLLAVEFDEVDATDLCHNLSFSWLAPPNLDNRDSQYDPPRLGASKLNTGVLTAWR
jgi:hypothetical protein